MLISNLSYAQSLAGKRHNLKVQIDRISDMACSTVRFVHSSSSNLDVDLIVSYYDGNIVNEMRSAAIASLQSRLADVEKELVDIGVDLEVPTPEESENT